MVQLGRIPEMVRRKAAAGDGIWRSARETEAYDSPQEPPYARTNWQSYIVRLSSSAAQKQAMQALHAAGIGSRRGIMCAHLEEPYASLCPAGCLPNSEKAHHEGIVLPLYSQNEFA